MKFFVTGDGTLIAMPFPGEFAAVAALPVAVLGGIGMAGGR
ncbi:MAG: hypothetical protein WCJ64_21220 [Rhodospirillaceae bacterium]